MNIKYFTLTLTIVISLVLIFPTSDSLAQGLRVDDKIGGSGSSSSSESNSDNSLIYIVGGAVIVGIVAYALLRDKSDKKKSESDSSEVSLNENLKLYDNSEIQAVKIKDKIPVEFYFGTINEPAFTSGKKYLLGVSLRL